VEDDRKSTEPVVHVVDDDPPVRRALSRLLHSHGFRVELFSSAEELLQHRCHSPGNPGCVIADLQLPGLNGLDLQETLRKEDEPLPVIFLTGHGDIRSSVRAMKGDAVDFLTKPVSESDLIPAIKRALAADAEARKERRQKRELLARYKELTPREREVMAMVVRGLLNKQIAFELGTVERTIKAHRAQIMAKMQVQSLAELVRVSGRLGDVAIREEAT